MYKFYIWLKANFIRNKKLRQRYRKLMWLRHCLNRYKFGVSYSIFDGEELLESSIKSIRSSVDYVNVVYQTKSWKGKSANKDLLKKLNELKDKGLIDELIFFEPNLNLRAGVNEAKKRNIGLKAAYRAGVKYFMCMDTDEFYKSTEIDYAKRVIIEKNISYSFCNIVNYGLEPTKRILQPCSFSVQFFSKINRFSFLKRSKNSIALVDPTRQLFVFPFSSQFYINGIEMHHFSLIRKDIDKKFKNTSYTGAININKYINSIVDEDNSINVPDYFGIKKITSNWKIYQSFIRNKTRGDSI